MTREALCLLMLTHEREFGAVMIHSRILPSLRRMTGGAIFGEPSLMRVVLAVTGVAITRRALQIHDRGGTQVTASAGGF